MDNNNLPSSSGIGFLGALQLLFVGLKLGHVITWSWWAVLSPLWLELATAALILAGYAALAYREARR